MSRPIPPEHMMTDQQFRHFAAHLSAIIWRTDATGKQIVAPRWAAITGKVEEELNDGGWLSTIHEADRAAAAESFRCAIANDSDLRTEFRLKTRGGAHHWFQSRAEPVRNASGTTIGWLGIANNIDEQKRAEDALLASEARLQAIITAARIGTIELDVKTGLVDMSPSARSLTGIREADNDDDARQSNETGNVTLAMLLDAIHPDDRPTVTRAIEHAMVADSNGELEIVFRAMRRGGDALWMSARGTFLFDGAGTTRRATRFVGVTADLTGHMADLAESARFKAIISSTDDAIIATTTDGAITHWNAAAERVFGYTATEMIGETIMRLVPPELTTATRENIAKANRGEPVRALLADHVTKSGDRIIAAVTLSPIHSEAGRCTGISAIVRDVTNQKRLEAELARAQTMEAVGHLAGGIAHDLNNMLTAIIVGMELTQRSAGVDEETRKNVEQVRLECFRAAGMIRQLLTVAKRQVIDPHPCDINEILHQLTPMIERLLGDSVELILSSESTSGIFADPRQIGQVILNLAVNAHDAMPRGGTLSIATTDDLDNDVVRIRVTDTGTGMTPDVQARLFEPFFTTKDAANGPGLGLSASYGVISQAGGSVTVESALGVGSTFTITLPATDALRSASAKRPDSVEVPIESEPLDRETILVVEDTRTVRTLIVRYLSERGFRIIEACNGVDALAAAAQHSGEIDLVLTDVIMPEMGGPELATRFRALRPGLRVLFMSGYSSGAADTIGVIEADAELLQKPFELAELARRVRCLLDESDPPARAA